MTETEQPHFIDVGSPEEAIAQALPIPNLITTREQRDAIQLALAEMRELVKII